MSGQALGKLREEATGEMEQRRARDLERKRAEKSREREEERWGDRLGNMRGTRWAERERRRGAEMWGEKERERREREAGRGSRRQAEAAEGIGKWGRRNLGTQGLPEVRGTRVSTWSQPSGPSLFTPWGFKEEGETATGRRSWGGWPSQSSSPHPPETPPTHLPRTQPGMEALCSAPMGTLSAHREAGTKPVRPCVDMNVCAWRVFLTCCVMVAPSESWAFPKDSHPRLRPTRVLDSPCP